MFYIFRFKSQYITNWKNAYIHVLLNSDWIFGQTWANKVYFYCHHFLNNTVDYCHRFSWQKVIEKLNHCEQVPDRDRVHDSSRYTIYLNSRQSNTPNATPVVIRKINVVKTYNETAKNNEPSLSQICKWYVHLAKPQSLSCQYKETLVPWLSIWRSSAKWAISWDYGTFRPPKIILQTGMRSHPVELDVWFLVGPFVYFHTLCERI